jgi:hypothetical protein
MYAEARTSLAASLLPVRLMLLFAGVALVEVSLLTGAVLWTVAAATVVPSILLARSIDHRRPPVSAVEPAVAKNGRESARDQPPVADGSHVPAPEPVRRAPARPVPDGATSAVVRPSVVCGSTPAHR